MNNLYGAELVGLGVSLTELAVKGTTTAIAAKVKTIKDEKNVEKIRNTYDEIVNALLSERDEAIRIAQAYKAELETVVIKDEDIEHLHRTIARVIEIIKDSQVNAATVNGEEAVKKVKAQVEPYEQIKELISVDTLKTMQLLGFNYKAAIGEPLTLILKNFILTKVPEPDSLKTFEKFVTPSMVEILKNKTAYDNFRQITQMV